LYPSYLAQQQQQQQQQHHFHHACTSSAVNAAGGSRLQADGMGDTSALIASATTFLADQAATWTMPPPALRNAVSPSLPSPAASGPGHTEYVCHTEYV